MALSRDQRLTIRLGPTAAAVYKKASKKQWRSIVKKAHAAGYSVNAYLDSSISNALKERTPQSIRKQATESITSAYKPALEQLDEQDTKARNIHQTQTKAQEGFNEWLKSQTEKHIGAVTAADTALKATQQALAIQDKQRYADMAAAAVQNANARQGNVSNNAQSTPLTDPSQGQLQERRNDAQAGFNAALEKANVDKTIGLQQQSAGFQQAALAAINNNLTKSLGITQSQRGGILADRAKAIAGEYSALMAGETNKATTLASLGQAAAIASGKSALDAAKLAETARHNKAGEKNTRDKLSWDKEKSAAKNAKEKNGGTLSVADKLGIKSKFASAKIKYKKYKGKPVSAIYEALLNEQQDSAGNKYGGEFKNVKYNELLARALAQQISRGWVDTETYDQVRALGINPKGGEAHGLGLRRGKYKPKLRSRSRKERGY